MRIFFFTLLTLLITTNFGYTKIAAVIGDPLSGDIYFQVNKNTKNYPASLTKMMTLYIIFDYLDKDKLLLTDKVKFSNYAASQQPSKLNIPVGQTITVEETIEGLIIKSGNDAAVAIAEKIAGSEKKFVNLMNKYAEQLKMNNTNFSNPNGLPNKTNLSSAYDIFLLGSALYNNFSSYMGYFNKVKTNINGVNYSTHNKLVKQYKYYKGIKTGYIRKSGFQIALLGIFNDKPLLGVYFGGNSAKERNNKIHFLMNKVAKEKLTLIEKTKSEILKKNNKQQYMVQTSSFKDIKKSKKFLITFFKNNFIEGYDHILHHIQKKGSYFITITEQLNLHQAKELCEILKEKKLDCLIKRI